MTTISLFKFVARLFFLLLVTTNEHFSIENRTHSKICSYRRIHSYSANGHTPFLSDSSCCGRQRHAHLSSTDHAPFIFERCRHGSSHAQSNSLFTERLWHITYTYTSLHYYVAFVLFDLINCQV